MNDKSSLNSLNKNMWVFTILVLFVCVEVFSIVSEIDSSHSYELVDFSETNSETEQNEENNKEDPLEVIHQKEYQSKFTIDREVFKSRTILEVFTTIPTPPPNFS